MKTRSEDTLTQSNDWWMQVVTAGDQSDGVYLVEHGAAAAEFDGEVVSMVCLGPCFHFHHYCLLNSCFANAVRCGRDVVWRVVGVVGQAAGGDRPRGWANALHPDWGRVAQSALDDGRPGD